jgi:hypothetical protein
MRQRATRQRQLFEDQKAFQPPQLPEEVQKQTTRLLTQWMEALARAMGSEVDNEQDRR